MNRWVLLRDIGTWGSGLALIFWQAARPEPSELIVGAALVLIAPGVYPHVKALLPGRTGSESSSESPPPPSSGSSGHGSGDGPAA